jgi:hypothetical protein
VGNLRFGYPDTNDWTNAGGSPPILFGKAVVATWDYRGLRPGAVLKAQVMWGTEGRSNREFPISAPTGNGAIGVVSYPGLSGGNARYPTSGKSVIITVDGQEMARGGVALG